MGVNMFDNFEQFEPSAATKYAKRVDRFLDDWVPKNRPVIDEFTRLLNQVFKSVPKALTLDRRGASRAWRARMRSIWFEIT